MKRLILFLFVSLTVASFGQETKLMNLCHSGNDRIDLYLKCTNGDYCLYAELFKDEGFYVNKGSDFTLITIKNDTINLIGLKEGQAELYGGKQNMVIAISLWRFINTYQLNKDQVKILKATEVKRVSIDLVDEKMKMDVTSIRDNVIMRLFEKFD
jgi:hypothetical protein